MVQQPDQKSQAQAPLAVQSCRELLLWLIPQLDKFPRVRRFTLGERLETAIELKVLALCQYEHAAKLMNECLRQIGGWMPSWDDNRFHG